MSLAFNQLTPLHARLSFREDILIFGKHDAVPLAERSPLARASGGLAGEETGEEWAAPAIRYPRRSPSPDRDDEIDGAWLGLDPTAAPEAEPAAVTGGPAAQPVASGGVEIDCDEEVPVAAMAGDDSGRLYLSFQPDDYAAAHVHGAESAAGSKTVPFDVDDGTPVPEAAPTDRAGMHAQMARRLLSVLNVDIVTALQQLDRQLEQQKRLRASLSAPAQMATVFDIHGHSCSLCVL